MIKNLNQLKRTLRPGVRLEVTGHCRPSCIGQLREVTWVNTQGVYTKTLNPPDPRINAGNDGRGAILWWGAARTWEFEDGGGAPQIGAPQGAAATGLSAL